MLWIKAFHILFVIAWMTGLFYFPRILVHYVEGLKAGEAVNRLVSMGSNLFHFMTVTAVITMSLGIWLWLGFAIQGHWLTAKLMLVMLLMLYHGQCYIYLLQMRRGAIKHTGLFFRIYNETPLLIVVPILILVVAKPF